MNFTLFSTIYHVNLLYQYMTYQLSMAHLLYEIIIVLVMKNNIKCCGGKFYL